MLYELKDLHALDKVAKAAFEDELIKISALVGRPELAWQLQKLANDPELLDRLIKEAFLGKALGKAKGFISGAPIKTEFGSIPMKPMIPSFKSMGGKLQATGQQMRETAEQAVTRKGHSLNPQQAAHLRSDVAAAGIPQPTAATRIGGHMVEGMGKRVAHTTPSGALLKSVGIPFGGAMEGLARGAGEELVRGSGAIQTGLGGAAKTMGGGVRGSLGRGLQAAAPRIGTVGEMVGVPALATAAGIPLTGLGLIGGKAMGVAAPALEHALHAGGDFAHHIGSDVAGVMGQRAAALGGRVGSVASSIGGKLLGRTAGAIAQ